MGRETERKFLVRGDAWRGLAQGVMYRQGYLNSSKECTVRVRMAGDRAFLAVKGITVGATREEYEYAIPCTDAMAMLATLAEKPLVEKKRYTIPFAGMDWEVDEFFGENQGLIVAELELHREDQPVLKPEWIGDEVTGDPRYYNSNLAKQPFSKW